MLITERRCGARERFDRQGRYAEVAQRRIPIFVRRTGGEFDKMENEKWWVSFLNPPYSHLPSSNCEGVIGTIVNNTYLGDAKFDAPLR